MKKDPIMDFDTRAWITDPQLRMASPATRGIWMDMLCFMRVSPQRGIVTGSVDDIARLVGASNDEILLFISEARKTNFCDIRICHDDVTQDVTQESQKSHAFVTIENRRMVREEKAKENARLRQQLRREKKDCHTKVTVSTVVEEVIINNLTEETEEKKKIIFCWERFRFDNVTPDDLFLWRQTYPAIEIEAEIRKAEAWLKANPKNKKKNYERFVNNWLSRAQERAPARSSSQTYTQPGKPKMKYRCDKCDEMVDEVVDRRGMKVCITCFRLTDPRVDEEALNRLGLKVVQPCH
jgi:hypothetical protein